MPVSTAAEPGLPRDRIVDRFIRLDRIETAVGIPLDQPARGARATASPRPGTSATSARSALEELVAAVLRAGPVVVSFSGGRDSSAVLAVAVHVARREGLPLPVPLTLVYPGLAEADESDWQRAVLDHLGLTDSLRQVTITDDERLLGAPSRRSLARHGLVWPAAAHANVVAAAAGRGAQVLTGEGGDEVLGVRRITPWTVARSAGRPQDRGHLREMVRAASGPALPLGPAARMNPWIEPPDWLRGPARGAFRLHVTRQSRSPWRYDRATSRLAARRIPAVLAHNVQALGDDIGVRWHHPLQDPRFLDGLARDGGAWGFRGRTDTMRFLFSDLLPDRVLSRRSKASFNGSRFGDAERDFAVGWDGSGVDDRLVDVDALRRRWLGPRPGGVTGLLLHQAWLAQSGRAR